MAASSSSFPPGKKGRERENFKDRVNQLVDILSCLSGRKSREVELLIIEYLQEKNTIVPVKNIKITGIEKMVSDCLRNYISGVYLGNGGIHLKINPNGYSDYRFRKGVISNNIMDGIYISKISSNSRYFATVINDIVEGLKDANYTYTYFMLKGYYENITVSKDIFEDSTSYLIIQHPHIMFWYKYTILTKNLAKVDFNFLEEYDEEKIGTCDKLRGSCKEFGRDWVYSDCKSICYREVPLSLIHHHRCFQNHYVRRSRKSRGYKPKTPLKITESEIYDIIRNSIFPIPLDEAIKIGWIYKRYLLTLGEGDLFDLAEYFYFLYDYYDFEQDWVKEYTTTEDCD